MNITDTTYHQGQELQRIAAPNNAIVHPDERVEYISFEADENSTFIDSITVTLEDPNYTPWAVVRYTDGNVVKVNLALMETVTLKG